MLIWPGVVFACENDAVIQESSWAGEPLKRTPNHKPPLWLAAGGLWGI